MITVWPIRELPSDDPMSLLFDLSVPCMDQVIVSEHDTVEVLVK